jgi:hypothetical protein
MADRSQSRSRSPKTRRGKSNTGKKYATLPPWAKAVADEALNSPIAKMEGQLKDANVLAQVLRNLIAEKKKVKEEIEQTNAKKGIKTEIEEE